MEFAEYGSQFYLSIAGAPSINHELFAGFGASPIRSNRTDPDNYAKFVTKIISFVRVY